MVRRFALAVITCALLGAWTASPASAHWGQDEGSSCAGITLTLAGFPVGENQVTTTITIDGVPVDPVVSTFQGPAANILVPLPAFTGTREVRYQTTWTIDGGGQTTVAVTTITCGTGTTAGDSPMQTARRHYRSATWWWRVQQHCRRP